MISIFDWMCLYWQIGLLLVVGLREFIKPKERNIYVMAICASSLILVQGQAWWVLSVFDATGDLTLNHINKIISAEGASLANLYIGLSVTCFFSTYFYLSRNSQSIVTSTTSVSLHSSNLKITNYILLFWVIFFATIAVVIMGGVEAIISKPGQFMGRGATVFLVLVHVGRLPLIKALVASQKITLVSVSLFGFVALFQLFNGRGWMLFFLLQLCIAVNYCRRELSRKWMVGGVAIFLFVIFIFGMYRHFTSISESIGMDGLAAYISKYSGEDNPINWFYSTSLESFTGLAGLLTFQDSFGDIANDFGLSNLGFWIRLVPYQFRMDDSYPFVVWDEYITGLYAYPDSITRSGYESFYVHFGLIGVLAIGVLFSYFANKFHSAMINPSKNRFLVAIFSAYIILPLYGNLFFIFFYSMTELINIILFSFITLFSRFIWMANEKK